MHAGQRLLASLIESYRTLNYAKRLSLWQILWQTDQRFAYACMKDNLDYAATSGFLEALDYEAENMVRTAQTRDHKEAVRAFVEKRRPSFNGNSV